MVYGTPGIFIPIKDHFEQEHRANSLGFKYDDIFRLAGLMEEKSIMDNGYYIQKMEGCP